MSTLKKDRLHQLIISLSKSERRYFKLFSQKEVRGSNYLLLFDAIAKQESYDEEFIRRKFRSEKFINQLHVAKNYLRKMIYRSLREFHAGASKDAELKEGLRNIEILYNKELYDHCFEELNRLNNLANKYELSVGQYELGVWRRKLDQIADPHNYPAIRESLARQQKALDTVQNTISYWKLATNISGNIFGKENNTIDDRSLLEADSSAHSLEAKVLFYNTRYLNHLDTDHEEEAEEELRTLLKLMENYPNRIDEEPGMYVSTINNLLSFLVFTKQFDEALELIAKSKGLHKGWKINSDNRSLLKQILRTYNIELEIYRIQKSINIELIKQTESFVVSYHNKMPKEYLISYWFQLSSLYFMAGDFSRSLYWINKMLNARIRNIREDLQIQAQFLNLIIHYEQSNFMVLRYFVDSLRRALKKIDRVQPFQEILLRFFTRLGRLPVIEHRDEFHKLHVQLFPKKEASIIPDDMKGFIDYEKWVVSKMK